MNYIPLVIEKNGNQETSYDIFSRLLKERIILLNGEITDEKANVWIAELLFLAKESDDDIYMYINSPGGSVTAGLAIYDTMKYIKPKVITICIGLAASMGAFLLSSGDYRYTLKNSQIMIHEPSTNFGGNASDIFNQTKWLEKVKKKVDTILASNTKHTLDEIQEATKRDYYMDSDEAINFRIVDSILIGS